jgi:hypothetical protein
MASNWITEVTPSPVINSGAVRILGQWDLRYPPDSRTGTVSAEGTDIVRVIAALTIDHNDEEVITVFASGWPVLTFHEIEYASSCILGIGAIARVIDSPRWEQAEAAFEKVLGGDNADGYTVLELLGLITLKAGWAQS